MKILLDGHGGDNAPKEVIFGAIDAVNAIADLEICIVGQEKVIKPLLDSVYSGGKINVVNADEIIGNDEIPTRAIREKKNSSMVVALNMLHDDTSYAGFVSAGSTGSLLTGALMICKRIKGISRPALVPLGPTVVRDKKIAIVDCGANADCKPLHLCHFALMGTAFIRAIFGIQNPRVSLLNNGTEEGKGSELTKETYHLLKAMPNINFIGNMEARDMLIGDADVIVTDGFSGNIALKANEGMAKSIFQLLKEGIAESGLRGKIGALCLKPTLRKIKRLMDVNQQAGGCFLGVERIVVKGHGSSTRVSIKACIDQAIMLARHDVVNQIKIGLLEMQTVVTDVQSNVDGGTDNE